MPSCPFCSGPVAAGDIRCPECQTDLRRDAGPVTPVTPEGADDEQAAEPLPAERIAQLLLDGQRLQAVREWQQATGCDLVEAVEAVDRIADKAGIPRPAGCAGLLMAVVLTLLVPAVLATLTMPNFARFFLQMD